MALANKCDRCGKFYEHYPTGNKMEYNAIGRISKYSSGAICSEDYSLDLCPECMSEFNKFMNESKFDAT